MRCPQFVIAWTGLALFSAIAVAGCDRGKDRRGDQAPAEVTVSQPLQDKVPDQVDFTGEIAAVQAVEIRARVSGYLDDVPFVEGKEVKKGDKLYQIDPRPYKAALDKANGELAAAVGTLKRAESDLVRAEQLFVQKAASKADYDQALGNRDRSAGMLEALKAEVESADLNLKFTEVKSPIAGKVGKTQVTAGNLVQADKTLLTTVLSVDPVYGEFKVDDNTYLRVQKMIRDGKLKSPKETKNSVFLALANEEGFPHEGFIKFVDNKINPGTGTILIRGEFPNPQYALTPGIFVRVRMPLGQPRLALLVSERALASDQGQKFLLVVDDKNKVVSKRVKVGHLNHGLRVIEEGISPEDWIIVDGIQRVRPGETVTPQKSE